MTDSLDSEWVYSVVLSDKIPKGWRISYKDIVLKKNYYFHPLGINGWPKTPVNWFAFRYNGRLQSIRKVESYEFFTNINDYISEIPMTNWDVCVLYKLGEEITPKKTVTNGRIYPSGRVWANLNVLLNSNTIFEATTISKKTINN